MKRERERERVMKREVGLSNERETAFK